MTADRLSRYIARRFSATLGVILLAVALVIFLADYVEVLRRFSDETAYTAGKGVALALMRVPFILDGILPFAFLVAALLSLLALSRNLELVVARASGVSVWGFLRGPFAIALLFGAFASAVLNPVAVELQNRAALLEAELSGSSGDRRGGLWLRQDSESGRAVIHGAAVAEGGLVLLGVTAFVFDARGAFREKASATLAEFSGDRWVMGNAEVLSAANAPRRVARYELPTGMSPDELRRMTSAAGQSTALWNLPAAIALSDRTGGSTDALRVTLHALINRPLFLMAMVAIAATVSLRLTRYGGTWRLVLTGVALGFLLYVFTEILGDFGKNGVISPVLAAWLPPIVALTFGATALLYQEDG